MEGGAAKRRVEGRGMDGVKGERNYDKGEKSVLNEWILEK